MDLHGEFSWMKIEMKYEYHNRTILFKSSMRVNVEFIPNIFCLHVWFRRFVDKCVLRLVVRNSNESENHDCYWIITEYVIYLMLFCFYFPPLCLLITSVCWMNPKRLSSKVFGTKLVVNTNHTLPMHMLSINRPGRTSILECLLARFTHLKFVERKNQYLN